MVTNSSDRQNLADRKWHALATDDALHILNTNANTGLSREEAERRQLEHGANKLTPQSKNTALRRLIDQVNNVFIYMLLTAAAVTAILGETLDSGVIIGVVVVIIIIGFIQEGRAEQAIEAVRGMLAPKAKVLRNHQRQEIAAEELVPGDIVVLTAGDRVPADLRLIKTRNLQIQEAMLTGESLPIDKDTGATLDDAQLGDRTGVAFSGTVVTTGDGLGLVVAIGDTSEIGKISGMLSTIETLKTPLMQRLDGLAKTLSIGIIILALVTLAIGIFYWNEKPAPMFIAAVSIAVAAIPEGLPAVMTVALALGVRRMARNNAIIRRLPAVETLGSVTIICSDKTGTLTRNEMTARTIRTIETDITAEGVGYDPRGKLYINGGNIALGDKRYSVALDMVRIGLLCNDASLLCQDGTWTPEGDPTEAALITLAHKAELDPEHEAKTWSRIDSVPFASERRYMATLHQDSEGHHFIFAKGAPEQILDMCSHELHKGDVRPFEHEMWMQLIDKIAARGERVLAVARKEIGSDAVRLEEADVEHDMTMLGLFGFIDPPREEAILAVATCQNAGIRVKMITGDHKLTARAIARQLGLANSDQTLTGKELDQVSDEELRGKAMAIDVFARANPEHKLRLVSALQASGQVTSMTGDGVNDAPALKRANIGVAMGQKGTDAAREASAMVLADDNFASIARAIEEGRTVYDNLKKTIMYLLPTSFAEALVIVVAILLGQALPITPVQVLWINMVTAVTLGMALAWEQAEGNIMRRAPRPPDEPLLTGFMLWRIGFVATLLLLVVGGLFLYEQSRPETSLQFSRSVAVNTLVMGEIFYLLNARFFLRPSLSKEGLFGSRVVLTSIGVCIFLQILFTYLPFMNHLFGTEPLDLAAWIRCIGAGLLVFVAVELEKFAFRSGAFKGKTFIKELMPEGATGEKQHA